jgi:hypothetical protein
MSERMPSAKRLSGHIRCLPTVRLEACGLVSAEEMKMGLAVAIARECPVLVVDTCEISRVTIYGHLFCSK